MVLEFLEGLVRYYLNATAPLNESTSNVVNCTVAEGSAQDSFMWYVCPIHVHVHVDVWRVHSRARYDDLHFSQQTARVLAREMAAVMNGQFSPWVT